MKINAKSIIKHAFISLGLFLISGSIAFYSCSFAKKETKDNTSDNKPSSQIKERPVQVLMANVMSTENFKVDMDIDILGADNSTYTINMENARGSLTGLVKEDEAEKGVNVEGDLSFDLNGLKADATIGFYKNELFFDINDNKFRILTDKFFSFFDTLPSLGINVEIPEQIKNLDLKTMLDKFNNMEFIANENGDGYFKYDLGVNDVNDPIYLKIKSNKDYDFKGIATEASGIMYQGTCFKLDCDFEQVGEITFHNPRDNEEEFKKYTDFSPALDVFSGFIKTFQNKQNKVIFELDMKKKVIDEVTKENVTTNYLTANLDFDYSVDEKLYSAKGMVNELTKFKKNYKTGKYSEETRKHNFNLAFNDQTMYVDYNQIKVSFDYETQSSIIDYIAARVSNDAFEVLMNKITEMLKGVNIQDSFNNLGTMFKDVVITSEGISFKIDPSAFGLSADLISFECIGNSEKFNHISLKNLSINDYVINLDLSIGDYSPIIIQTESYERADDALCLIDAAYKLVNRTTFRTEISGSISDEAKVEKPINISGGLQFDVKNKYGYGDISLVDQNNYKHTIEADFSPKRANREILFAYNKELKGYMNESSITDLMNLIQDITMNPDDHFIELFGELLNMMGDSPLNDALKGDIGALFVSNIFSNLEVSASKLSVDVSTEIIGLDGKFNLVLNYDSSEAEGEGSVLHSLEINNFKVQGKSISFKLELKDFDETLESKRLNVSDKYFNFSDIKVLLELGVNTSKFNYYEFEGGASLSIGSWDAINLNINAKVRNDKGNVRFSIEFSDVPLIGLVNKDVKWDGIVAYSPKKRSVSFYYADNMIYLYRYDSMRSTFGKKAEYVYTGNYTVDYFFKDTMKILCKDALGLTDSIYNMIDASGDESASKEIKYEKLLTDFGYVHTNENNKEVNYFKIGVNISELTHNNKMKSLIVKVYKNQNEAKLEKLEVNLIVNFGLTITVSAYAKLTPNCSIELTDANKITTIDTYLSKYGSREVNKTISNFNKL